ncbi:MAG: hypothetical protein M3P08_17985, partial [Thermoproteota archaeon]|nr:hypothetical protein [Thermoproteota archaeon]
HFVWVAFDGIDVPVTRRKEPAGTFWPWFGVFIRKIEAIAVGIDKIDIVTTVVTVIANNRIVICIIYLFSIY